MRGLQLARQGGAVHDAVDKRIQLLESQLALVQLEALALRTEGDEEVRGLAVLEVEGFKDLGAELDAGPHQLDGIGAVLMRELPRCLLHLGVCPSLEPEETDLAVVRATVSCLVPLAGPLLEGGLRPCLLPLGDRLHDPEVNNILLQLKVELLRDLADVVERVEADDAGDADVVLPLDGGLEDAGLVAAQHDAQRGAAPELAA
mmetsp:Transcript_51466/g.129976  ORF Transcript_51466/g.129976 Transcript_51466/m.129976 type:complete len:203 (-) Transcript_51466:1048-1656(-)